MPETRSPPDTHGSTGPCPGAGTVPLSPAVGTTLLAGSTLPCCPVTPTSWAFRGAGRWHFGDPVTGCGLACQWERQAAPGSSRPVQQTESQVSHLVRQRGLGSSLDHSAPTQPSPEQHERPTRRPLRGTLSPRGSCSLPREDFSIALYPLARTRQAWPGGCQQRVQLEKTGPAGDATGRAPTWGPFRAGAGRGARPPSRCAQCLSPAEPRRERGPAGARVPRGAGAGRAAPNTPSPVSPGPLCLRSNSEKF